MISGVALDLIVIAAVGIALIRGWSHGSIREFFGLVALFAGILAAPLLVGPASALARSIADFDLNTSRIVALAAVIGVASLVGAVIGVRVGSGVDLPGPRRLDGIGGVVMAVFRSLTVVSLILYGTLGISTGSGSSTRSFAGAVDDSLSGQLLANPESPFTIFYDTLLSRSDDLRALTLWVRQRSVFRERVPSDRLDFAATDAKLSAARTLERRMLELVNSERTTRGLDLLVWCERCAVVGRSHSKDMYRHGYFSHVDSNGDDPFDRMRAARIAYAAAGENLSIAPAVKEAHEGLMSSPDHRENILRALFDEVGIGCYEGPYGLMCTQVFRATP